MRYDPSFNNVQKTLAGQVDRAQAQFNHANGVYCRPSRKWNRVKRWMRLSERYSARINPLYWKFSATLTDEQMPF